MDAVRSLFILLLISSAMILTACGQSSGIEFPPIPTVALDLNGPDPATQGPFEQASGYYTNGLLQNGTDIGLSGYGYIKVFKGRNSGWGTFDLIAVIKKAIDRIQKVYPQAEPIQIGDMSHHHGGPIGGHASHQNGLDADIRFLSKNAMVQIDSVDTGFEEDFVVKGKLSSNFDLPRNWTMVKGFVSTGRVQRIFVDAAIKKALCNYAASINEKAKFKEALRRLSPEENHIDHMHVRITCPSNSPHCVNQKQPAESDGC